LLNATVKGLFQESPLSQRDRATCVIEYSLSHSRSLNAIQTGTIRKLEYSFPFAFHSNYGSILYHFGDKARY